MSPKKSYWIWFTPRTGSTLLCKGLELTGIGGKPGEFFNFPEEDSLTNHYCVKTYEALREKLWRENTSPNGIVGIKYSLYHSSYDKLAGEIISLRNLTGVATLDWRVWSDLFPNCRHIFLSRRDKIRLAVSWWKAIQDNQWHRLSEEPPTHEANYYEGKYNFDALLHLLKESNLREAATQAFFDYNGIQPLTIIYEDFVRHYEETIKSILCYLDSEAEAVRIAPEFYTPTADEVTEEWVQRFRGDLQKGWEKIIW